MQEHLKKYCDSCFESLTINFQGVSKRYSRTIIHALRLDIKRIRALIDMVEKYDSTFENNKTIRKFDKIFKYSGNLRDLQVETQILKSLKNKKSLGVYELMNLFEKHKGKQKKQLQSQLNRVSLFEIVLLNQRLIEIIEISDKTEIRKSYNLHIHELKNQLIHAIDGNIDKSTLHDIRFQIKGALYSIELLKKGKQRISINQILIGQLNDTQQELGKWHDLMVLHKKITFLPKHYHFIALQGIVNDLLEIKLSEIISIIASLNNLFHNKKEETEVPSLI